MKEFEKNIINLYGEPGKQWLANLPQLTAKLAATYGLSNIEPVKNLSYNYVLAGLQGSRPIILKLGLDTEQFNQEALALKNFTGFGAVHVLEEKQGMLLLERAVPGTSLKCFFPDQDNEAIHITCECLKRLHQAPIPHVHELPNIKDWLNALDNDLRIPADYLRTARKLRDELIATSAKPALLHGDLHHDNILQHGNQWIVIDPKGVIGEPAYDVAAFIRNPLPEVLQHPSSWSMIEHRIDEFAKILELPKQRISHWCYVQSVLAWAWVLEDNSDETYFRKLTELFSSYL